MRKSFLLIAIFVASSAGFLTSCSSAKDASPDNFSKVIEKGIENSPTCPIGFFFPASMDASSKAQSIDTSNKHQDFEFLVKQGFVKAAETQAAGFMGLQYTKREFSLTPEGEKNFKLSVTNPLDAVSDMSSHVTRQMMGNLGAMPHNLCVAKGKKFIKIIKFNEPTEVNGVKTAQIAFSYKNDKVAEWVNTQEFTAAFPKIKVSKDSWGAATLRLNNDGWEVAELVGLGF